MFDILLQESGKGGLETRGVGERLQYETDMYARREPLRGTKSLVCGCGFIIYSFCAPLRGTNFKTTHYPLSYFFGSLPRYRGRFWSGPFEAEHPMRYQEPITRSQQLPHIFTDLSIFSLNLPRIQTPAGTTVTNHKHGLDSLIDVGIFIGRLKGKAAIVSLTDARSCRTELTYFAGKEV